MFDPRERELHLALVLLQQRVEGCGVELGDDEVAGENRLHLRREHEAVVETGEIERLDSEAVARGDKQLLRFIVGQEGELAAQMLQASHPMLLIEMEDDL